ncbi:hypothetical protein [Nitrobacter sp.]|uniref:hypothetical protein n=1 Tax=Nitrobacter sp. TaxID=29420 RepID=UPI00399D635A
MFASVRQYLADSLAQIADQGPRRCSTGRRVRLVANRERISPVPNKHLFDIATIYLILAK